MGTPQTLAMAVVETSATSTTDIFKYSNSQILHLKSMRCEQHICIKYVLLQCTWRSHIVMHQHLKTNLRNKITRCKLLPLFPSPLCLYCWLYIPTLAPHSPIFYTSSLYTTLAVCKNAVTAAITTLVSQQLLHCC